ncbi:hypothetical protein ACU4GD_21035 [Cupriavidus basilensis]
MMDAVVPGGVAIDPAPPMMDRLRKQCDGIEREVRALRRVYDERCRTAGPVSRHGPGNATTCRPAWPRGARRTRQRASGGSALRPRMAALATG